MKLYSCLLIVICIVAFAQLAKSADSQDDERRMHPQFKDEHKSNILRANPAELEISYWQSQAQSYLNNKIKKENVYNTNKAKNIIFFLGDGMSLETLAATRVYMGGEEVQLSFEKFPHVGLSKTYCVNAQVADSACTATAFLHGVKGNYATIGLNAKAARFNCEDGQDNSKRTESMAKWAQTQCKATGFVTTARVTHATPAGVYAHIAHRDWESDTNVKGDNCDPEKTIDIARQLIENDVAKNLKVILGGGRRMFRNHSIVDEENEHGSRSDGRDLIDEWLKERSENGNAEFVWNKQSLESLDYNKTDYLLGLFEADHLLFNADLDEKQLHNTEPTLSELTEAAIKFLQKSKDGYFLFVESARIDSAHHENWARKALDETREFSNTIELARKLTNESDTLIIVTSDHAHTMTYNGYPYRGNDILGLSGRVGSDGIQYSTLSYANGLGFYNTYENGSRADVSKLNYTDSELRYMATVPRDSETHGGQDVGVYASGPWSHLFVGNYEQNNIPLLLSYAAKIGPYADEENPQCDSSTMLSVPIVLLLLLAAVRYIL